MSSGPSKAPPEPGVAALDFIYACSICCASFADVYQGRSETVQGLSDGINPKERLVTRLFLANCCHVLCGDHLEGGGPPFHPAGQRPKAPCPVCIKEKGNSELRDLYSIRGFNKDEYDPHIPPSWFTAPPIRLDGPGKEMEALRFQYIALIRYCQNTHATRKPIQDALAEAEKKLASMQHLASEEHAKVLTLQHDNEQLRGKQEQFDDMKAEMQRLQGLEQEVEHYRRLKVNPRDLETFVTNKAAIRHYLKLVPMLIEQNEQMKKRLASLGFAMALEPVPNLKSFDPETFDSDETFHGDYSGDPGALLRKTASSHTAGRSAHASGRATAAPSSPFFQRPMKRQRLDSPLPGRMQIDQPFSRDAMPPPPKPVSRMRSVRQIIPSLRKKFSHGRSTPASDDNARGDNNVQMYDTQHWQNGDNDRPPTRHGFRGDTPYMSGALPVEQPMQAAKPQDYQLLSSVGINDSRSEFTFRSSSPIKTNKQPNRHQPVQLPTEPSYIRLMDGLSQDTGVELGLKDPRESTLRDYRDNEGNRQVMNTYQERHQPRELESQTRWSLGHPFLHQSPHGSSSLANRHLNSHNCDQTNGYANRAYDEPTPPPGTPTTSRYQQPGHQIENVVSPFFENGQVRGYTRTGFAEPQDSSIRFGASQSQRARVTEPQASWREPRSLNGLSFFDSPVNSRNKPIRTGHGRRAMESTLSSRHYQRRNLDSGGFITRPETGRSPYVGDSAYGPSRDKPTHFKQAPLHSQSAIPCPSFKHNSFSRAGQIPSAMPSIVSRRSPLRPQPQWETLQRMGVRSSRQTYSNVAGNAFASSTRDLPSSVYQRTARR